MQQGIYLKTPFQLITDFGIIKLFLNATLGERTLCEMFVRDASGTEANSYLPALACKMIPVHSSFTESCKSCTDCLFLVIFTFA